MASPNTEALRLRMARLEPRRRFVIRRAMIPVNVKGKSGKDRPSYRLRVSVEDPSYAIDGRGNLINPARHMSETDRRALGLSRNGQPRRPGRATALTADTPDRKTAA